jgi:hypothetical protein
MLRGCTTADENCILTPCVGVAIDKDRLVSSANKPARELDLGVPWEPMSVATASE